MTNSRRIDSILGHVFNVFEWIVRILLMLITLLIAAQVFLRFFFKYSIPWAEEVSLTAFIYITFFTMAIAMRYDLHLRVELFVARLPKTGRRGIELFDNLFLLFISVLMIYTGVRLCQFGTASIMAATRLPTTIIYIPTPITGLMCFLQQILRITGIAHSDVADKYIEGVFKE